MVDIAIALTLTSLAVYTLMMALFAGALRRRRRAVGPGMGTRPHVSILKPLAGTDDDLEENLESFARIDYPSFDVLLGVAGTGDPAFDVATRFVDRHPELDAHVVLTNPRAALNPKVAQLMGLEQAARGDVFVVSDSNVRVRSTYLWSMIDELGDPRVGMVTSLFSGTGERTLGAALENLQICASTAPGVAAMNVLSERPFTVGKSMAVRRGDLPRIGGFAGVADVLAEDHLLGRKLFAAGFEVRLSREIVENRNVACSIQRTFERHTRWAKLRRSLFPAAFCIEPLSTPVAIATLGLVAAPSEAMLLLWVAACFVQMAWATLAVQLMRGHAAWWHGPLEILRAYVSLACWACACWSRVITWRGHPFRLMHGSAIVPVALPIRRNTPNRERLPA